MKAKYNLDRRSKKRARARRTKTENVFVWKVHQPRRAPVGSPCSASEEGLHPRVTRSRAALYGEKCAGEKT